MTVTINKQAETIVKWRLDSRGDIDAVTIGKCIFQTSVQYTTDNTQGMAKMYMY